MRPELAHVILRGMSTFHIEYLFAVHTPFDLDFVVTQRDTKHPYPICRFEDIIALKRLSDRYYGKSYLLLKACLYFGYNRHAIDLVRNFPKRESAGSYNIIALLMKYNKSGLLFAYIKLVLSPNKTWIVGSDVVYYCIKNGFGIDWFHTGTISNIIRATLMGVSKYDTSILREKVPFNIRCGVSLQLRDINFNEKGKERFKKVIVDLFTRTEWERVSRDLLDVENVLGGVLDKK